MAADGGCVRDMGQRMNEGHKAEGSTESVLGNRGLGMNAKKSLYLIIILPTTLSGAEAWGMRSAERR